MKARSLVVLFAAGALACGSGDGDEAGDRALLESDSGAAAGMAGSLAGTGVAGAAGTRATGAAGAGASAVGGAGASGAAGGASGRGVSGAPAAGGGGTPLAGSAGTIVGAGGTSAAGRGGSSGASGVAGAAGTGGAAGAAIGGVGGGAAGAGAAPGETGRLVGMTAAHNVVRARQMNPTPSPALPPLTWSAELATTAQAYANKLATDCSFQHSRAPGLGENLALYGGTMATPQAVTEGWAAEQECYTFGKFMQGDSCNMQCAMQKNANGCGHYTQIIWRNTTELGCGVATCASSSRTEIWVCNYKAPGNYVGQDAF
jgi:pathogenesis-related protein 1